jgi:hypothetical protein
MDTRPMSRRPLPNPLQLLAACGAAMLLSLPGCDTKPSAPSTPTAAATNTQTPVGTAKPAGSSHDHDHDHDGHDHDHDGHDHSSGHGHHDSVPLGSTIVGDYEVSCWQAHGSLEAGKELFITIKPPFDDAGRSVLRVWIGTEDRLASVVARASYVASRQAYEAHAEAPSPLPHGSAWWIEIERPDGSTHIGTIKPH